MSRTNPIVGAAESGPDRSGLQTATAGKNRLTGFSVYSATVTAVDTVARTLTVMALGTTLEGCTYAPGAVAAYMGFTDVALPPVGSSVLLMYLPTGSLVIGTQPSRYDATSAYPGNITGDVELKTTDLEAFASKAKDKQTRTQRGYAQPSDLLPGEMSVENGMGIIHRMLYNFEQISAGDLAKIEVHLLNDMVRIVDNYFVHHNVGGDTLIWSNGRCNYESHFTGYPHEAEGKKDPDETLAESSTTGVYDPEKSTDNPYSDTGRWRKSTYVGFLADMIHTWVTDPTKVASTYNKEAHRAGKYRSWVGSDGTVMVQTVAGVHVEVVRRVVVPTIHNVWNDPDVTAEEQIASLNSEFLTLWGRGPDWADLSVACWQMRNYAKYITLYHSLARFKQLEEKGGCTIPTEKDSPEPSPTCQEEDKIGANPASDVPYGGYALFSMDPSGSISLVANGVSSVIMNQGNIQISTPGNIEMNAGGMVSITGKNVSVKAMHHVEIAAIAGMLSLKARTAWNALCEVGRMWLKSDAKNKREENKEAARGAYPLKDVPYPEDVVDPVSTVEPETADFGVMIDAAAAGVCVSGKTSAVLNTTGEKASVWVQATGANSSAVLFAQKNVHIMASVNILVKCVKFGLSSVCSKITSSITKIGDMVRFTRAGMDIKGFIKALRISTINGYVGPRDKVSKYQDPEPHQPDVTNETADAVGTEAQNQTEDFVTNKNVLTEPNSYSWSFNKWTVGDDVLVSNSLKASLFNDAMNTNPNVQPYYAEAQWKDCGLIPGPRTYRKSAPWPGIDAQYFEFSMDNTDGLGMMWDKQFDKSMIANVGDMEAKPFKLYFTKSNE